MSYSVSLNCCSCGRAVRVDNHREGATYNVFGSDEAEMNVTYNYAEHFRRVIDPNKGLWSFDGKRAEDTLAILEAAVAALGTDESADYWEPTEGNAARALRVMLRWAKQHPSATWSVA